LGDGSGLLDCRRTLNGGAPHAFHGSFRALPSARAPLRDQAGQNSTSDEPPDTGGNQLRHTRPGAIQLAHNVCEVLRSIEAQGDKLREILDSRLPSLGHCARDRIFRNGASRRHGNRLLISI
jgi:hypothetical protein